MAVATSISETLRAHIRAKLDLTYQTFALTM